MNYHIGRLVLQRWMFYHHQISAAAKTPTHNELRYVECQIHITKYIKKALNTKQPMKNTTHKRTQWSQKHNM